MGWKMEERSIKSGVKTLAVWDAQGPITKWLS
jgi:hypothetical protein